MVVLEVQVGVGAANAMCMFVSESNGCDEVCGCAQKDRGPVKWSCWTKFSWCMNESTYQPNPLLREKLDYVLA